VGSRRVLTSLAVAAAILLLSSESALGGRQWCASDPILTFADGSRVQWVTTFESDYLASLTGPVAFYYEVPSNAGPILVSFPATPMAEQVTVAYTGATWNGRAGMPVRAAITVRATISFRTLTSVRGNVAKSAEISGWSGQVVKTNTKVDPLKWFPLVGSDVLVSSVLVTGTTTVTGP
jgi:hypothetical protein